MPTSGLTLNTLNKAGAIRNAIAFDAKYRLFTGFLRQKAGADMISLAFLYRGTTACPRC